MPEWDQSPVARPAETTETDGVSRLLPILVSCIVLAALPVVAYGKDRRPEVRTSARCNSATTADLRLRTRDAAIRVRLEIDHSRAGAWNVVLVHERQVAWKGRARIAASHDSFELERTVPDYPGSDSVTARATGPRGVVCQVTAAISDVSVDGGGAEGDHGD
jgi:hypothetical protein